MGNLESAFTELRDYTMQLRSKYEKFARNFDLAKKLYENGGCSREIMIKLLEEQQAEIFNFGEYEAKGSIYTKVVKLYKTLHDYLIEVSVEKNTETSQQYKEENHKSLINAIKRERDPKDIYVPMFE